MALVVALLATLASCGQGSTPTPTPEHTTHSFGEWSVTKNATCTEDGVKTRYCSCGEKQSDTIPATDHNKQVIPAVESTCTENGLTEGLVCSTCGEVFVEQQEAPLKAHVEQIIPGVESTCTSTGLTEGKKCSVCDTIIVAQQTTSVIAHTYDDKYDETCNKCGFVRDAECAHRETETLKGYAATCTYTGLTDGTKCKKCAEILVAQTIIPVIDHSFGDWLTVKNPTVTEQGIKERYCTCGAKETDSIPMLKASEGLRFNSNGDGTCYVSSMGSCTDSDLVIPAIHNGESVTGIGDSVFSHCYSLESVVIPDSVTSIGKFAFYDCSGLESVVIGDSVTSIGHYAFNCCSSLTSIKVDSNNSNYKDIDGNLYTKDGKTLVRYATGKGDTLFVIPNSVTSIGYAAFSWCSSLTNVVIPDGVTSIGDYAFEYCVSLTSAVIPNSVTSIGHYAFDGCSSLESVVISDSVTSIGDYAFCDCSSLTSLVIPGSVTSIGYYAFEYCSSLTNVVICDSVTNIGYGAFAGCFSLTGIVIPDSVTSIDSYAFCDCTSLTSIKYRGTEEQWNTISKGTDWDYRIGNYTITYNYKGE